MKRIEVDTTASCGIEVFVWYGLARIKSVQTAGLKLDRKHLTKGTLGTGSQYRIFQG